MSLTEKLSWRYATKKFDATKKIPADKLNELLAAVKLSPSSFGLQHYEIIVVEDADVRTKLRAAAHDQSQITDASAVVVFAAELNIDEAYITNFVNETAKIRQIPAESLDGYKQYMIGTVAGRTDEEKLIWAQKQTYLALGILIAAASELEIDTCPMEGFDAKQFDEILGLKEKGLNASVIVTIGYRADDDPYSKFAKVRKTDADLFTHI